MKCYDTLLVILIITYHSCINHYLRYIAKGLLGPQFYGTSIRATREGKKYFCRDEIKIDTSTLK